MKFKENCLPALCSLKIYFINTNLNVQSINFYRSAISIDDQQMFLNFQFLSNINNSILIVYEYGIFTTFPVFYLYRYISLYFGFPSLH